MINNSIRKNNIRTTKFINGETANYTLVTIFSVFLLCAVKQLFKVFIGVSTPISVLIGFVIAQTVSYLLEKRFVFAKKVLSSNTKQILTFIFRVAIDFGFYKIFDYGFGNLLKLKAHFVWLAAITVCFVFNYYFDRLIVFDCAYEAKSVKNSKIYRTFYKNRFVLLSVIITGAALGIIYLIYRIFPFGDSTVMRMDLYHQYGPLFSELYERIVEHKSFLYSWNSGGGSSFLGNYFNYLSSPLSALIFLFDKEDISYAISFIVAVKCLLSSATFSYYLKISQNKHNVFSASFGAFYAFSAYFLAYYWNVMWLDGMFLLPIIALGIERIINNGKPLTYIVSMIVLFLSSYYMGFMSCIFAVLYFLCYYITVSKFGEEINPNLKFKKQYSLKALMNSKLFNRGVIFTISSITAGALCAFVLIPVFLILRSCSATSDSFPTTFESYFNIFDFITSHLATLETTIRSSGDDVLPNIYSGMLAVILLPLFVVNKDIRLKEKFAYISLLLFFLFSFDNNCMNFVWHAFHFPNDLPFRFSYMYSFIVLVMGSKCLSKFKSIGIKDIGFVAMAWVFFIVLAQKMSTTKMSEITIYFSIAFIIIWCAVLYMFKNGKAKKTAIYALVAVMTFSEIVVCDTTSLVISQKNSDYKSRYSTYTDAIEKINDYDDGFYREELTYLETRMDPCYYGYNGMSTFSSMAYEEYSGLQYTLGMFGNRINSYTYNTQTPVYNMMFNIKYLIKADSSLTPDKNLYNYLFTTDDGKTKVYENRYYLPIAYCVNENVKDWDTEEGNPFEKQQEYFKLATGYDSVFDDMEYTDTEFDSMTGDYINSNGTYWFSRESESGGYVDITISPKSSGNAYLYVKSPDIETIEINSKNLSSHTQTISEPYILDLGYCEKGEEIKVTLDCTELDTDETSAEIYAYTLDDEIFKQGYQKLLSDSIEVTKHNDTVIEGKISVDKNSYLYTSIPYDKGWKVYIDGKEVETFSIGKCLLATTVKPGEHTIKYVYTPRGIYLGIAISAVTAAGICGYIFYRKRKKAKENTLDTNLMNNNV